MSGRTSAAVPAGASAAPQSNAKANDKPTLGGARIKTRKRNIQVPLDPATFTDAVIQFYNENTIFSGSGGGGSSGDGGGSEDVVEADTEPNGEAEATEPAAPLPAAVEVAGKADLDAVCKALEATDLDFSRYGDTLFEVIFTGGRMATGGKLAEDSASTKTAVLNEEAKKEPILPYITMMQKIIRRRPFLIKNLENIIRKLIQSLEHYQQEERDKVAVATALVFSTKVGLPPEPVFQAMQNDVMIQKGSVLRFITVMFREYLADTSLEELVSLLRRGKLEDTILELFPSAKRSNEFFAEHFTKEGMIPLVEYHRKKLFDVMLKDMRTSVTDMITEGAAFNDVLELIKTKKKEGGLPDIDVLKTTWDAIMGAVQWAGKNTQQNAQLALRQVKTWGKLLAPFATSGRLELELLYKAQQHCYEDAKLMKIFPDVVRVLYELDVLSEDSIIFWYRKGTNPKGRNVFVEGLAPFIKWLEEAEEEEEDE